MELIFEQIEIDLLFTFCRFVLQFESHKLGLDFGDRMKIFFSFQSLFLHLPLTLALFACMWKNQGQTTLFRTTYK